jgi:hypothetical protein
MFEMQSGPVLRYAKHVELTSLRGLTPRRRRSHRSVAPRHDVWAWTHPFRTRTATPETAH